MTITSTNRRTDLGTPATTGTTAPGAVNTTTPAAGVNNDAFVTGGRAPTTTPLRNGGLPDTLLEIPGGAKVVHGTDPGDYYCEHMFFQTQTEALKPGSSVVPNSKGEKLVGFLHVPSDAQTNVEKSTYTQAARFGNQRQVVGSALRGYYDEASKQVPRGPIRMMVNGYGKFEDIKNNPTGDFVTHRANLDAAMSNAFGADLVSAHGERYTGPETANDKGGKTWQYVVRDPESRKLRTVLVRAQSFAVADSTINGTPGKSVQSAMGAFKPHAVLSMGVGMPDYTAEFHADNGGMRMLPKPAHDDSATPTKNMPDNRSLARAILKGGKEMQAAQNAAAAPAATENATTVANAAAATPAKSPAESVGAAAKKLIETRANNYGVNQPWYNEDPNHALPAGVPLGGLKGRWKCNLFGGNAIYKGGFEPPYYGNKGKGEYPNANQFYKWSDKYAAQFGNKVHFAQQGEITFANVPEDQRTAAVNELLKKAQPGDLVLVEHQGGGVVDGGHTRVVVANNMDKDGTLDFAQASSSAGEIHTEDASHFTGEVRMWVERPNRPLKPATTTPK